MVILPAAAAVPVAAAGRTRFDGDDDHFGCCDDGGPLLVGTPPPLQSPSSLRPPDNVARGTLTAADSGEGSVVVALEEGEGDSAQAEQDTPEEGEEGAPPLFPAETAGLLQSPGRLLPPPPPPPERWSGETERKLRGDGERHGKNTSFLSALEQQQDGADALEPRLRSIACLGDRKEWRREHGSREGGG